LQFSGFNNIYGVNQMSIMDHIVGLAAKNMFLPGPDIFDIIFSLVLSVVIAIVISQIYKLTHRGMSFELSFMSTLVLLSPIVAVVMLFIRGDLVLSLGLIGSLSIIRFRAPIKDTRDMVFLFWSIAVGLGCGTYNWSVVIISTIFITIVMFTLYFVRYGRSRNSDFILVVNGYNEYNSGDIEKILLGYTDDARVRSHESDDNHWEIIYEMRLKDLHEKTVKKLIDEVKAVNGVAKVSLLAPQLALPV